VFRRRLLLGVLVALAVAAAPMLRGFAEPRAGAADTGPNLAALRAATAQRMAQESVIDIPIRFIVRNVNRSAARCATDGRTYTVRGHLTAPADPTQITSVTLYQHGLEAGEWYWRLDVPGYHHAEEMARSGQASVTIDRLGYGQSDKPNGLALCLGGEADITAQIIDQLRHGTYAGTAGWRPVAFTRVLLAGQDVGAQIAEITAYSFHDVDGLVLLSWTDQGLPDDVTARYFGALTACMRQAGPPGDAGAGYVSVDLGAAQFRSTNLAGAVPAVADAASALREPQPCGDLASQLEATPLDRRHLCEVDVPVLLVYGADDDRVQGAADQRGLFCGTPDVQTASLPYAGHYPVMSGNGTAVRRPLLTWLDRHTATRPARPGGTDHGEHRQASLLPAKVPPRTRSPLPAETVDIPVSFAVADVDRSASRCASDGRAYTIRGHLTVPAAVLARPRPAVTLYIHGTNTGEWIWRVPAADGVTFVAGEAARGHASVTIDRLGYGSSDRPNGFASCTGAHADIVHQIVGQLRAGTYHADGVRAPRFSRVVLAGHSSGALVAEIEAYSFHDIDGVISLAWAAVGLTPDTSRRFFTAYRSCLTAARTPDRPGDGYVPFDGSREDFLAGGLSASASPAVVRAVAPLYAAAPCGVMASEPMAILQDLPRISQVDVPVFLVFGARDVLRQNVERYPLLFTGSRDVTTLTLPDSGHFVTVDVGAAQARDAVAAWLDRQERSR
jgi:alpha-beta hydrolase superfamily lysophospholipase